MIREEFRKLVQNAVRAECEMDHCPDIEPYLLAVLNLVKSHPSDEPFFRAEFARLVADGGGGGYYLIPFCMRELRWPEVREAACRHFDELRRENLHARYMSFLSQLVKCLDHGSNPDQLDAVMALEEIGRKAKEALPALRSLLVRCVENRNQTLENFTRSAIAEIES